MAAALLGALGIGLAWEPPGPILVPIVVGIVSVVDAYRAAKHHNAGGSPRPPTGGIWALLALGGLGVALAQQP